MMLPAQRVLSLVLPGSHNSWPLFLLLQWLSCKLLLPDMARLTSSWSSNLCRDALSLLEDLTPLCKARLAFQACWVCFILRVSTHHSQCGMWPKSWPEGRLWYCPLQPLQHVPYAAFMYWVPPCISSCLSTVSSVPAVTKASHGSDSSVWSYCHVFRDKAYLSDIFIVFTLV